MAYLRPLSGPIASCGDEIARSCRPMSSALRREYLAALGLETWVVRAKSPPPREVPASREAVAHRDSSAAREAGVDWPELRTRVAACTRCSLCNTRTQTVFGVGNQTAEWLIVGEAPGAEED